MTKEALKVELRSNIRHEAKYFFGETDESWISYATDYFWDESVQDGRLADLELNGVVPGHQKILDMAAGCGQFVFRALKQGYDCYGIEPEEWKLDFIRKKAQVFGYPTDWPNRIIAGIGEDMPYFDNSFDCITSYQTLEHVQNPLKVISEMVRITKPGGLILIRCPDYLGTYEGHYHLPWFPLMHKSIAKVYLRVLGKPTRGLDTIQYITRGRVIAWLTKVESEFGCRLSVVDADFIAFSNGLRRRSLLSGPLFALAGYSVYRAGKYFLGLFRREQNLNMAVRIQRKSD